MESLCMLHVDSSQHLTYSYISFLKENEEIPVFEAYSEKKMRRMRGNSAGLNTSIVNY
jgi:hypothetical protein